MTKYDVLDLRELAQEWRDAREELNEATDAGEEYEPEVSLEAYRSLCAEIGIEPTPDALEDYGDSYEPTLIAENYFEEYAEQLAEDICPWPSGSREHDALSSWPYRHIDWEAAARELKYDYTSVTFDGGEYYIRSV